MPERASANHFPVPQSAEPMHPGQMTGTVLPHLGRVLSNDCGSSSTLDSSGSPRLEGVAGLPLPQSGGFSPRGSAAFCVVVTKGGWRGLQLDNGMQAQSSRKQGDFPGKLAQASTVSDATRSGTTAWAAQTAGQTR